MAAEIFTAPKHIIMPSFSTFMENGKYNRQAHNDAEKKYLNELKEFLLKHKKGDYIGDVIKFPVADGYAQYMVASMRPLQLVHLPLGDAWDFEYVHLMTAKEVKEKIEREKKFAEIWAKAK